jgi:hypothetical protein
MVSLIMINLLIKKIPFNCSENLKKLEEILKYLNIKCGLDVPMDGDCAFWCLYVILATYDKNVNSILKRHIEDSIINGRGTNLMEEVYVDFYSKKNNIEEIINKLNNIRGKFLIRTLRDILAECYAEKLMKKLEIKDALCIYNDSKVGKYNESITHDSLEFIFKECINMDILSIIPAYEENKFWQLKKNSELINDLSLKTDCLNNNIILLNSNNHYYLLIN